MKIYTKKGDAGQTSLFDGTKVTKGDARVDAYGDVDELNAAIGAARAFLEDQEVDSTLAGIQADLFSIGAQLADPKYDPSKRKPKTLITEEKIVAFEKLIDGWETQLKPLRNFILPAGSKGGSMLHLARCVCRRAERKIVALAQHVAVPPLVIKYMNRLSDLLFVMARVENKKHGEQEVDW
ncbi:MAG: cob(I)yrinic acid a,c-diamide adenosyltransferase [Planctomycetes bacterium]|nr:cob(I)yrinic acid a,c-diamide adenosyltransferase [Planctomycetota bacterium]